MHLGAEHLHQRSALRLAVVADAHLPHLARDAEQGARVREGGAPLAGTGLRGEAVDAADLVVVHLRHRGVDLVGASRGDALVLDVDAGGGAELLLPASGAEERRRAVLCGRRRAPARGSAMYRSWETSWRIRSMGNNGARSSGPAGSRVPGCSGGGGGVGRSATMLYQLVTSSSGFRV